MCKALRASKLVSCRCRIVMLGWISPLAVERVGNIHTVECAHYSVACQVTLLYRVAIWGQK